MENKKLLKKKIWAILKAAMWGGGLSLLLMLALALPTPILVRFVSGDFLLGVGFFLNAPTMWVRGLFGMDHDSWLVNWFVINTLLCGLLFAAAAFIWQILKEDV